MLRVIICAGAVLVALATSAFAQVHEPERGSAERRALLDAVRPHADWHLGAPIEFVVQDLRVFGDIAFANLVAQRPGGEPIDLAATPMALRGGDVSMLDGSTLQALYVRSGEMWVALHWAIGPTDVWWAAPELCAAFYPVISDACAY